MSIWQQQNKPYKLVFWKGWFYVVPRWWTMKEMES